MKKILLIIVSILILGSCGVEKKEIEEEKNLLTGKYNIVMNIQDYGEIYLELDADVAPITVTNFIELVESGFYDGLTFHRIIDGFMIQGGDPNHNGSGGSEKTIKGEFAENGVGNTIKHERGVISMARSNDFDSASCQFFIVHQDSPHLDGSYATFGRVTKGMKIVDKIIEDAEPIDNNGTMLYEEQPVIESIKLVGTK